MSKNQDAHCSMDRHIDRVGMRERERQAAKAYMHDADILAGFCGRAIEQLRFAWEAVATACRALAR